MARMPATNNMEEYRNFCIELVRLAGSRVKQAQGEAITISHKGDDLRDFVTAIDVEVSDFLIGEIKKKYPDHRVSSEEKQAELTYAGYEWVLDPIEGTANFARHIPHFSVCVGLLKDGTPIAGAIYNPITAELFSFAEGIAYLNDSPVRVSAVTEPSKVQSIFVVGHQAPLWDWGAALYRGFLEHFSKNKSLGSAALDLAFLAAGRADVVVYGTFSMPDAAVGVAMVRAAGGEVYSIKTGQPIPMEPGRHTIAAVANAELFAAIRPLLRAELLP